MTSFASHETSTFLKISLQYVGTHFINPAIMTWIVSFVGRVKSAGIYNVSTRLVWQGQTKWFHEPEVPRAWRFGWEECEHENCGKCRFVVCVPHQKGTVPTQQPNPSLFDLKHRTRFEFYVQTFQSDSPKHILDKCSFTNQVKSTKGTVLASGQDIDGIMYVFRFERISRQMFSTCAFVPWKSHLD